MLTIASEVAEAQIPVGGSPAGGASIERNPAASKVFPLAVITNNFDLVPGQAYPLIYSDTLRGRSNLAPLDFTGAALSAELMRAWLECGYNPAAITGSQWVEWCPEHSNAWGWGPTMYWLGGNSPDDGPYYAPGLRAGAGRDGWWLLGPAGAVNYNACVSFAAMDQQEYVIPLVDIVVPAGGTGYFYHLRALPTFRIHKIHAVCQPPPGESQRWYVEGVVLPK